MMGKRPVLFLAALALLLPAQGTEYWVLGTSQTEGWYDVNKTFSQDFPDSQMCWAASASNMLAWWQDHNPEYNDLAAMDTPESGQEIFDTFKTAYENDGGIQAYGILWYLQGDTNKDYLPPLTEEGKEMGGYYGNAITQIYSERPISLGLADVRIYNSSIVSEFLKECIVNGYSVGLGIYGKTIDGKDIAHAVTLWGIDYDEERQMIQKMYLTDSDDVQLGKDYELPQLFEAECRKLEVEFSIKEGEEIKQIMLEELGISCKREGRTWYNDTMYVGAVSLLKTDRVPEPGTSTLGLVALAALCTRRRRSLA